MIEQIISLAPEQEVNCGRSARPRVLVCPQSFHPLPIPPCPSPMMRPGIQHWSALIYCMNCCVSCPVSLAVSDRVYATGRGTVIAGRAFPGTSCLSVSSAMGYPRVATVPCVSLVRAHLSISTNLKTRSTILGHRSDHGQPPPHHSHYSAATA